MSSITPLNTKTHTFSSTSSTSSSPAISPTTTTSSSSGSSHSHTLKFLDKTLRRVKSFAPQHHQSTKSYPQPPMSVSQQHYNRRRSAESTRRPTVTMYGRHSNEWLFGGVSVRRAVGGLFQHED